jgi:hypothetical protein
MIDSLIKQQTAWSQGSSKYKKQKKCTRSEISVTLSFYVYIIPRMTLIITSKVGLLIFQLSITEVSSALDHSNK